MKACAVGFVLFGGLLGAFAVAACHDDMPRPEVPPLTVARPEMLDASTNTVSDASTSMGDASVIRDAMPSRVTAAFAELPAKVDAQPCTEMLLAVTKGTMSAMGETLKVGDVIVVMHGDPFEAKGPGTVLTAKVVFPAERCAVKTRPSLTKTVVRANAAPELKWANGTMSARLDVGAKVSPEVYMGRLAGTAPVAEHMHLTSWEIIAAIEANGSFMINGTEGRLAPGQVVVVPPGARHAWKPDPGSKLVALQMYDPPGPEQRFVTLAAGDKDAGAPPVKDAGALVAVPKDASAPDASH